ncbi:MAG: antibiotic biosynthesis monooxygenase [Candidatus Lokiarchaeota archaeon]|nr:antibiotic biosynthesis monooxygenase [Candidatus Lokiarchaeota archaeon]
MVTLIATLNVKEGKMEEAIELLKEIVQKVRATEPGCKAYIPHTVSGKKNANKIVFYEKYADKEALTIHSNNLAKNFEKLFPILEPGMDIMTCTEII